MTLLVVFEDAADEIEHERGWYRERSDAAEASLLRELDHAFASILEAPGRWPEYIAGTRRLVLPTFPFSLVYFTENDTSRSRSGVPASPAWLLAKAPFVNQIWLCPDPPERPSGEDGDDAQVGGTVIGMNEALRQYLAEHGTPATKSASRHQE
jgi:plasmid stabilization system protein ParE